MVQKQDRGWRHQTHGQSSVGAGRQAGTSFIPLRSSERPLRGPRGHLGLHLYCQLSLSQPQVTWEALQVVQDKRGREKGKKKRKPHIHLPLGIRILIL